jgi:hypothetical protein
MKRSLGIKFNEQYDLFFHCNTIPTPEGMYQLQLVDKDSLRGPSLENKKDIFLTKDQLMMICDYFNGVKNELDK